MPTFVQDCPRCHAKRMTFDIVADVLVSIQYDWKSYFEICGICRRCKRLSVSLISLHSAANRATFASTGKVVAQGGDLASWFEFERYITVADLSSKPAPDALPDDITSAFVEGTRCLAITCPNAAGAMFRLCLDLATKGLLPDEGQPDDPDKHTRRNLAPRLRYLFDKGLLSAELKPLSDAVKGNGDDGAHEGSLTDEEAEDIYDFAFELLDRIYSQPARLAAAAKRRVDRRREKN